MHVSPEKWWRISWMPRGTIWEQLPEANIKLSHIYIKMISHAFVCWRIWYIYIYIFIYLFMSVTRKAWHSICLTANYIHRIRTNPLNAKLNPISHLLALLGGATVVVFSRLRVKCGIFRVSLLQNVGWRISLELVSVKAAAKHDWELQFVIYLQR